MRSNIKIFDRLSFSSLFLVVVLLPLFCLPFTNIPVETSKGLILVLGLTACVVFWAIARFLDGRIVFPRSSILLSAFGIVFVFLLSALMSPNPKISLFGTMFDVGSFWFIFSSFILMLMASIIFRTGKQARTVLFGLILSSTFVLIFQIVHLFIPTALSLGILTAKTSNILGSWNALGLFAGFSSLMFLLVIEFFSISKIEKIILKIFLLFFIFLAICVNFKLVWILLGIFGLVIFVYKASLALGADKDEEKKKHFPTLSFIVAVVALLFFVNPLIDPSTSGHLNNFIPNLLQISNTEVSPTLGSTMHVTKGVLAQHPMLGLGPNRFAAAWSMYKPEYINNSQFWNVYFDAGSGLLPTLFATTGSLGILAWLVFLALFLVVGVKSVLSSIKNGSNWEMVTFFVLSLYLFISLFFYFAGTVIFLLAFAFTGIFIGLNVSSLNHEISVTFLNNRKKGFFAILFLILFVVMSITASFKYIEHLSSVPYFVKALSVETERGAEDNINKAISLYPNDLYLRTRSQIYLIKLNSIVNKGGTLSDLDKADIRTSFSKALDSAQLATEYDPHNYLNLQSLGLVYERAGSLGDKSAFSKAFSTYQDASKLNPLNPGLKLAMAAASFFDGKVKEAKDYVNAALLLKPDYADALAFLNSLNTSTPTTTPPSNNTKQ